MIRRPIVALAIVALAIACSGASRDELGAPHEVTPAKQPDPWSEPWLAVERERYLTDGTARRAALERSLTRPENTYSRTRLDAYGLRTRGWDLLPVWNPRSRPMTADLAARVERGDPPIDGEPARALPELWDGAVPATTAAWIALGQRVFFEFPMRAEAVVEHALVHQRAFAESSGVERAADGSVPGALVFLDVDGEVRVGMSCALCHSAVESGTVVPGRARRTLDYGRLRLSYLKEVGGPIDPRTARRMASWGAGRADVTEDDDEDPVAIPDLWGLRYETWLTQAATLRHESPLALAIRQETQLIDSNHQLVRPPRELVWALAMYLYSLTPPTDVDAQWAPATQAGEAVFDAHCRGCHASRVLGGEPVPAWSIGTDPSLAEGRGRGTGLYRVPPLLAIGRAAPYLHDGSVSSLEELLSPERLAPTYPKGRLGWGSIPGHTAGMELDDAARASLIQYLETL